MCEPFDFIKDFSRLDGRQGLPEELFLAISEIMPIANVDLMVLNDDRQILLSWRDDPYSGTGWHLPGGCIRYKETMLERVQKTALAELGMEVAVKPEPLAVRDAILGKREPEPRIRAHHLAVLYECSLPESFSVEAANLGRTQKTVGFLKWFDRIPPDMLTIHEIYHDIFCRYELIENTKKADSGKFAV